MTIYNNDCRLSRYASLCGIRQNHPEGTDKRNIKRRPIGVGFDRSHHYLQQGAPLCNDAKYIGLDVHQATISVAVLDAAGNLVMEATLETKSERVSDRTMVGTTPPHCLTASETEARFAPATMNLQRGENSEPLLITRAGSQDQISGEFWRWGKSFVLTSPFIERVTAGS